MAKKYKGGRTKPKSSFVDKSKTTGASAQTLRKEANLDKSRFGESRRTTSLYNDSRRTRRIQREAYGAFKRGR